MFLDEIDKIAGRERRAWAGYFARGRAARYFADRLEGTTVNTKYGNVSD